MGTRRDTTAKEAREAAPRAPRHCPGAPREASPGPAPPGPAPAADAGDGGVGCSRSPSPPRPAPASDVRKSESNSSMKESNFPNDQMSIRRAIERAGFAARFARGDVRRRLWGRWCREQPNPVRPPRGGCARAAGTRPSGVAVGRGPRVHFCCGHGHPVTGPSPGVPPARPFAQTPAGSRPLPAAEGRGGLGRPPRPPRALTLLPRRCIFLIKISERKASFFPNLHLCR